MLWFYLCRKRACCFMQKVEKKTFNGFPLSEEEQKNLTQPYTPAKRLYWLQIYHKNGYKSPSAFSRRYPINRRTIADWLAQKAKWQEASQRFSLDKVRLRESKLPELDRMLWDWFQDFKTRAPFFPLTRPILLQKAYTLYQIIKNPELIQPPDSSPPPPDLSDEIQYFSMEDFLEEDLSSKPFQQEALPSSAAPDDTPEQPTTILQTYRGFINPSVYCFANAILQLMYVNTYIRTSVSSIFADAELKPTQDEQMFPQEEGEIHYTEEERERISAQSAIMKEDISHIFDALADHTDLSLAASAQKVIEDYRDEYNEPLPENQQADAGEFFSQLISQLDGTDRTVRRLLSTYYLEQTICPRGHLQTHRVSILDYKLSLDDIISLEEAMKELKGGCVLEQYHCEECMHTYYQQVIKRTIIDTPPKLWIVSLNRFKYKDAKTVKSTSRFAFPINESFHLGPYCQRTVQAEEAQLTEPTRYGYVDRMRISVSREKPFNRAPHYIISDEDTPSDGFGWRNQGADTNVFAHGRNLRNVRGRDSSYYAQMNSDAQFPSSSSTAGDGSTSSAATTEDPPILQVDPEHIRITDLSTCKPEELYHLVGVVAHEGTPQNGHYISYIRQTEPPYLWLQFDDRSVTYVPQNTLPDTLFGWNDPRKDKKKQRLFVAYLLVFAQGPSPITPDEALQAIPESIAAESAIIEEETDPTICADHDPREAQAGTAEQQVNAKQNKEGGDAEETEGEVAVDVIANDGGNLGKSQQPEEHEDLRYWLARWIERHNIRGIRLHGEASTADPRIKENWLETAFLEICKKFDPKDIWNGDETGLFYDQLPGFTYVSDGSTPHGSKESKGRVTIMLAASMMAEKRRVFIIGHSHDLEKVNETDHRPYDYHSQKNAWMDQQLFDKYLARWNTELQQENRHIALIVDNSTVHTLLRTFSHITVFYLPPGQTSIVQPVDQGMVHSIKAKYRAELLTVKMREVDSHPTRKTISELSREEKIKQYTLKRIQYASLICHAWKKVSKETLKNCFKAAGWWEIAERVVQEQMAIHQITITSTITSSSQQSQLEMCRPTAEEQEALEATNKNLKTVGKSIKDVSEFEIPQENLFAKEPFSANMEKRVLATLELSNEKIPIEHQPEWIPPQSEKSHVQEEYLRGVVESATILKDYTLRHYRAEHQGKATILWNYLNEVERNARDELEKVQHDALRNYIQTRLELRRMEEQKDSDSSNTE